MGSLIDLLFEFAETLLHNKRYAECYEICKLIAQIRRKDD